MDSISTGQARKILGCTNQTVRNLIKDGVIEAIQGEDGRFAVNPESVNDYKRERGQNPVGNFHKAKSESAKQNNFAKKGRSAGVAFGEMVLNEWGPRPGVDQLYSLAVHSAHPVDDFDLETWIKAPDAVVKMIDTTPVFVLPVNGWEHLEDVYYGFSPYMNYSVDEALDYCHNRARWWWAVRSGGKIVARSEHANNVPGIDEWLGRLRAEEQLAYEKANPPLNWRHWLHAAPDLLEVLKLFRGDAGGNSVEE